MIISKCKHSLYVSDTDIPSLAYQKPIATEKTDSAASPNLCDHSLPGEDVTKLVIYTL